MVCVPCFLYPVLLFLWHKFLQPIVLKFWNPWEPVKEEPSNLTHENGENENNINKCLSGTSDDASNAAKLITDKKID